MKFCHDFNLNFHHCPFTSLPNVSKTTKNSKPEVNSACHKESIHPGFCLESVSVQLLHTILKRPEKFSNNNFFKRQLKKANIFGAGESLYKKQLTHRHSSKQGAKLGSAPNDKSLIRTQ